MQQMRWLGGGLFMAFLVPFLFADVLDLSKDLFYGIYATAVCAFFALWARASGLPPLEVVRRRWRSATLLGAVVGVVVAVIVLRAEDTTPRPDGLELAWAVLWRGVIYGAVDGLLLSGFPIVAVFAAAAGSRLRTHTSGTALVGGLALLASLMFTAVYHLGYSDFRSKKLARPVAGDVVWSVPTLATLNPLGASVSHATMHVTAVLHSFETDTFLPPHE